MDFYSITIDINERREHHLELYPEGKSYRLQKPKNFVIDVQGFAEFNIVAALLSNPVKCFSSNGVDIDLKDCMVQVNKEGEKVFVQIEKERTPTVSESEKPKIQEPDEDISFEEIEEMLEYEKPVPKKKKELVKESVIPEQKTDMGFVNEALNLSFVANNYAYKLNIALLEAFSEKTFEVARLEVVFSLKVNGQNYDNSIILTLSHPAEFLGMALDFGSEASQMAIKRYDARPPYYAQFPDNENLFKNIRSYHINKGWISKDPAIKYYQEEPGTNFYKSLFFLKEHLTGEYEDIDKEAFVKDTPDNLKMLINMADGFEMLNKEPFLQLPNLKILHKYERILDHYEIELEKDGYPIPMKLREFKQKVYNSIMEIMILSFLKKEFIRYSGAKRNIRMMLLIPNNYDTKDINKTQDNLNYIFDQLSKKEEYKDKIGAWEILTISESDAAFIGYLNKNNTTIRNNEDHIIIDSGKGTTDFSIIRTGSNSLFNLQPIYRNGFTGGGNLLTYAVFETVLHFIREQNPEQGADVLFIKEQILAVLKSNNLEYRNQFYNELERLKFNYQSIEHIQAVKQNWQQAEDGQIYFNNLVSAEKGIDAVTNLLRKLNGITDFYGYITKACQFIVNNVVSYLKIIKENKTDLSLSGVILTGRSFKFKMLADLMKTKLNQELGIPLEKIILLEGSELKDICIKGVFHNSIKLNAELTGYPIQIVYRQVDDMPQSEIKQVKEKTPWHKKVFDFFINDQADTDRVESMVSVQETVDFSLLQRSQFLIGCKRYNIRKEEFFHHMSGMNYHASIDFTQRGFVMRRKLNDQINLVSALEEIDEGGSEDKALIVPSLFPNFIDEEYIQSIQRPNVDKAKGGGEGLDFYPSSNGPQPDSSLFF